MLQKTKGIVLHTLKYNDTSIIVDMYTELSGRASFLVTVPRSRKAAVKSVLFQPLSFIEFEADYRPNATLYRVKEAKSFYPFSSIPYDPYKSSMALFLSEFLYRAIREEADISDRLCTFVFQSGENLGDFDSDLKEKTKKLMFCLVFRLAQLYR